jgi:tetratricopeptide (TPR) repeat protein
MSGFGARLGLTRYEADEHYKMALSHYDKRNVEQAILSMNRALELQPHNAEYHAARGFFYLEDGALPQAEADFDEALKRNAYELMANFGKGVIAYKNKHYETARSFFSNAWAVNPERAETIYYLAMVEHRLRNNPKAIYWMRQAYAIMNAHEDKTNARNAEKWLGEFERLMQHANLLK